MSASRERQAVNAEPLDEKVTLMKTINQQLGELYRNTLDDTGVISAPFGEEGLSLPFLIQFADDHIVETADVRVMFFGQETREWLRKGTVEDAMDSYRNFFNDFNEYPQDPGFYCWHNVKSPFWSVLEQMKSTINKQLTDKRVSYIWNNIVKADYKGKNKWQVTNGLYAKFRDVNRSLILSEIDIIKPDVLVFFTGASMYYDTKINDVFNHGKHIEKELIDLDGDKSSLAKVLLPVMNGSDMYISHHPCGLSNKAKCLILNAIVDQCEAVAAKAK